MHQNYLLLTVFKIIFTLKNYNWYFDCLPPCQKDKLFMLIKMAIHTLYKT